MMCRNENGADVWETVFTRILPKYKSGIKKDLLLKELEVVYPGKINAKNLAPLYSSYEDMFSSLGVLNVASEVVSSYGLAYDKEFVFLYAFILLKLWEEMIPNQDEISSVQLDTLRFGEIFGWNEEQEYKALESLSDAGIIRLNRQLMPYTILRLVSLEFVIGKLYSELC